MWVIFGAVLAVIDMCFHIHLFRGYMVIMLGLLAIIFIFVILALAFS